jgi:hypothetical protein
MPYHKWIHIHSTAPENQVNVCSKSANEPPKKTSVLGFCEGYGSVRKYVADCGNNGKLRRHESLQLPSSTKTSGLGTKAHRRQNLVLFGFSSPDTSLRFRGSMVFKEYLEKPSKYKNPRCQQYSVCWTPLWHRSQYQSIAISCLSCMPPLRRAFSWA